MTAAAGLSRRRPRIRADHVSPAARAARTPVVRTPTGQTSGDAAPAHADHADTSNTAASVSWLNESVSSSGGARPGRGVGTSVGRCRWRRIRAITEASSIRARWKTTIALVVFLRALMAAPQGNDVMARASQGRSAISRKRPPSFDPAQDGPEPRRRATARTREDVDPAAFAQALRRASPKPCPPPREALWRDLDEARRATAGRRRERSAHEVSA